MWKSTLLALCVFAGCKPAPPAAPEAAYRQFLQDAISARAGDSKAQHAFLEWFDAPTRAALAARATAASKAAGSDVLRDDPAEQLFQNGAAPSAVAEVQVVAQTPDAATLKILGDAGALGEVKLVREDGRWRIHLDALANGS